jgi:hypothetical protein
MKRSYPLVLALAALALFMGACSGGSDDPLAAFCETHTDPELEGLNPTNADDAEKLSAAMATMEENAPAEIKDDVTTTREGFEAAQSGDVENFDVEEFQAAATRVEEYAEENCT